MLENILKFLFNSVSKRHTVSQQTEEKIKIDWENINLLLKQKGPSQLRQALIAADKTLDTALRDIVSGETMGERLKDARDRFEPYIYNKIWEAHKVRNNLVHELGYEPPYFLVIESINDLRSGLREIGVKI